LTFDLGCINNFELHTDKGIKLSFLMINYGEHCKKIKFELQVITQVISYFFRGVLKHRCNWLLFPDCHCKCNQALLSTGNGNCIQIHFYGLLQ